MAMLQLQPALSYNFSAEAGDCERYPCRFQGISCPADNGHCYLVGSGTETLCSLYSQGTDALDECLSDEHQDLVSAVSARVWPFALGIVSGGGFQLVASSLNYCGPPSSFFNRRKQISLTTRR